MSLRKKEVEDLLIENGLITERQLSRAKDQADKSGDEVTKVLVNMGFVTDKDITEMKGIQLNVEFVDLDNIELNPEIVKSIPDNLAKRYNVIAIDLVDNKIKLAMSEPDNILAIDDIRLVTGYDIEPVIASESSLKKIINTQFGSTEIANVEDTVKDISAADFGDMEVDDNAEEEVSLDEMRQLVDEAPIVRVVNLIISQAINDKSSDIHIEPDAKSVRVRYRVDGVLHEVMQPPKHIQAPMVSRIKIMSNLDIAERRIPQDGKIHLKHDGREYDLRVSTLPCVHGEKVVMRILDRGSVMIGLGKLGFYPEIQAQLETMVDKPYGMVLVTGPTGSGKSTTLYSVLNRLNTIGVNIMTVEDPVEYQIAGINQVQQNNKAGLTFASALRSFLRQDPDIIMVGEIRDGETATIAVESALTGHLVLSTLHTNDSAGAVTRLIEMGIEPFLCSSSLICVLAQRLARTICPNCKEAYIPPMESIRKFGLAAYTDSEITFYKGRGCDTCKMSGYKGRTGIHELLVMSDRIRSLVLQRCSTAEIRQCAIEEGMKTMPDDGLRKVLDGITTIEECLRVVFIEGQEI